jgi:predicted naringenin-chalcone synthase
VPAQSLRADSTLAFDDDHFMAFQSSDLILIPDWERVWPSMIDDAGLRVLTWRDTTPRVVEYFEKIQSRLLAAVGGSTQEQGGPWRQHGMAILNAYIETLKLADAPGS